MIVDVSNLRGFIVLINIEFQGPLNDILIAGLIELGVEVAYRCKIDESKLRHPLKKDQLTSDIIDVSNLQVKV